MSVNQEQEKKQGTPEPWAEKEQQVYQQRQQAKPCD